MNKDDRARPLVAGRVVRSGIVSQKAAFMAVLVFLMATLLLPSLVLADNYEGGQPLTTVSSGIVSGGVYVDASPAPDWGLLNVTKTFSLPAAAVAVPGRIVWARLYVGVYCGHMQNNYATAAKVTFDGNGDGVFETTLGTLSLSEDQGFNFIVNGGNPAPDGGLPWDVIDDHTTRVSSDYLMWYNVTGLLTCANPGVNVNTAGSFDGRVKVITLVVVYNDGSSNQYYYWVNQGHDTDSYYLDVPQSDASEHNDYIGSTIFEGIPSGFTNASLTVNHMASSDGLYTFDNVSLPRYDNVSAGDSYVQGAYSGFDVWNVTGLVNSDTGSLTYDRSAMGGSGEFSGQFYKIPLAVLTAQLPVGVPGSNFTANVTSGYVPLMVQFMDNTTGPKTSWSWDFNNDGVVDSTAQNPVYTYNMPGVYTVNLTVTGPGGSNSKVRTGYVDVLSKVPSAAFGVNRTSGIKPLTVAFTDQSSGIVTGWAWDFNNDGVVDSTQQNPTYTYLSSGNYTVNLTVTGPYGSSTLVEPNLITASASAQYDLTVTSVSAGNVFALQNNSMGVTVRNKGPDSSPATVVEVRSSDGFVGRAAVSALASGNSTMIDIVDTTIRPLEGVAVRYTATVDPDNNLSETNETNNQATSISYAVAYNGYESKRYWAGEGNITTIRTYDLQGGIAYSQGDSSYHGVGWHGGSITWTSLQPTIPAGAKVVEAYVYASWTWDAMMSYPDNFAMIFNGQPVSLVSGYTDMSDFGGYSHYRYGLATYNVTGLYLPNSVNVMSVGPANPITMPAVYPFTLFVVYQDNNSTRKQIFINEEYDLLGTGYGGTPDMLIAYAPFTGMNVDMSDVTNATLYTFATNAGPHEGNLSFNGHWIATLPNGAYHGSSNTSSAEIYDVTGLLQSSGNVAGIQPTESGGMGAIQQVLVADSPIVAPAANFSANVTNGNAPLTVLFDPGNSTGLITSYAWDFNGDGVVDSMAKDPVYTYAAAGTYTVNLTVSGPGGNSSMVRRNYITTSYTAPVAAFSATPTSGAVPLTVTFDPGASTGSIASYLWSFGDGNTSTDRSPSHTYVVPGNYTVSLTVSGPAGSNTTTKADYVSVDYAVPVANFAVTPVRGVAPLTVQFSDMSSGSITSWAWDFNGDGVVDSTLQNPSWTYGQVGNYTVTLTVSGPKGSNTIIKTGFIAAMVQPPVANFTSNVTSGTAPLTVQFIDQSSNVTAWAWDFNDDGIVDSTVQNPTYTYVAGGNYSVRLTVTGPGGSGSIIRHVNVTGLITRQWGIIGMSYGVAVDAQDDVFVADTGNNLVREIFPNGTSVTIGGGFNRPYGVAVDGQGDVFVADTGNNLVREIYPNGSDTILGSGFSGPEDVDVDAQGNVFVADTGNQAVKEISPNGSIISYNAYLPVANLAVDSHDNVYYTDGKAYFINGCLATLSGQFDVLTNGYTKSLDWYCYGVTTDRSDNVYFEKMVDTYHHGYKIFETFSNGSTVYVCDVPYISYNAIDLAVDGSGNVFIDYAKSSPGGAIVEVLKNGSTASIGYGFTSMSDVAYDNHSDLYMYNSQAGATYEFFPNGSVATFSGKSSITWDQAVDGWGDQFVADTSNNTVDEVFPNGTVAVIGCDFVSPSVVALDPRGGHVCVIDSRAVTELTVPGYVPAPPVAAFNASPVSGRAPLTVSFVDQSTGLVDSWAWDFNGDGIVDSTLQNPTYTYQSQGNYTVNLTVSGPGGSNSSVRANCVAVDYAVPIARFNATPTLGVTPMAVQFNSGGTYGVITSYLWDFGDGNTSNLADPSHTYFANGNYTVTLTVSGPGGSNTTSKVSCITCGDAFVISLSPGWNLVSVPLSGSGLHASDLVGNGSLGVDMVASYSPVSGYLSYYPGAMSGANFALAPDVGYFVRANRSSSLPVYGQPVAAHNVSIGYGWNLVGWSSFANARAADILSRVNVSMVASYSPVSGYLSYFPGAMSGANFALTAGSGYFVESKNASVQQLYVG